MASVSPTILKFDIFDEDHGVSLPFVINDETMINFFAILSPFKLDRLRSRTEEHKRVASDPTDVSGMSNILIFGGTDASEDPMTTIKTRRKTTAFMVTSKTHFYRYNSRFRRSDL